MEVFNATVYEIVEKAMLGNGLCDDDIKMLYEVDPTTKESYYIQWAAQQMSLKAANGKAEVHAQIGLDASPCPMNCQFCSFAVCNGIRKERMEIDKQDVIEYAQAYEEAGANLILLLTTAAYKFEKLLEMAGTVREVISREMPLLVNTRDLTLEQSKQLKAVGVNGAYHAVRMGEGEFTKISPEKRLQTISNFKEAGFTLSTCVEPVGPEHTAEELTKKTRMCIEMDPVSGGVGRRTAVPGTKMYELGMLPYTRIAHMVAVYRLASGDKPILNCSAHSSVCANAGGNLGWAEVGTNPRDVTKRTEHGGRGQSVETAKKVFLNSEWEILDGFSKGWILN